MLIRVAGIIRRAEFSLAYVPIDRRNNSYKTYLSIKAKKDARNKLSQD